MDFNKIRIAGVVDESIVDGPGIRFVIFTQGCLHHCHGCHNPETWDPQGGKDKDLNELVQEINETEYLRGVTFSGGEPFRQADKCHYIASRIKSEYNLMSYSGYTFEELLDLALKDSGVNDFLHDLDILVDGRFELDKRSLALRYRGSTNQRVIDVKKSLASGTVVLLIND